MQVGDELRKIRTELNLPQDQLGEVANYSQKVVSQMENGKRRITPDFINAFTREFKKAVVLKARLTFEERSEFLSVPYLNSVDRHIQTAFDCIREEYREGTDAASMAKRLCRNKTCRDDFTPEELEEFMGLLDQIVDTYTANKMLLTAVAETFDIGVCELEDRHFRKLVSKKYYNDEGGCLAKA